MSDRLSRDSAPAASSRSRVVAWAVGLLAIGGLAYLGLTSHGGVPDPTDAAPGSLSRGTVVFDSAVLVLREGLEAILILAAVLAGLRGSNRAMRRPVGIGATLSLGATVATWFAAVFVLGQLGDGGLDVQAATGLLAVIVLLTVMNWFFHRVYWTGWMSNHHRRRRLLDTVGGSAAGASCRLRGARFHRRVPRGLRGRPLPAVAAAQGRLGGRAPGRRARLRRDGPGRPRHVLDERPAAVPADADRHRSRCSASC